MMNLSIWDEEYYFNVAETLKLIGNIEDAAVFTAIFKDEEFINTSDFIRDISRQWTCTGKLSIKQIDAVLRVAKKFVSNKKAMSSMPSYYRASEVFIEGVIVESITEVEVSPNRFQRYPIITNEVKMKDANGASFIIKTTAKKLLTIFEEAIEKGKAVDVFAVVSFGNEKRPVVHLSSKGAKVVLVD